MLRAAAVSASVVVGACSPNQGGGTEPSRDPLTVAAAFYPIAEAVQRIGGECVEVTNLTPPGVEPHDLELTPDDVEAIASSDLVIYLGSEFQPSVQDALGDAEGETLDVLTLIDTLPPPSSDGQDASSADPHVWLDPGRWADAVGKIAAAMQEVAPARNCDFADNARTYIHDLTDLDRAYRSGLADCRGDLIVTNHSAFGYLAAAYGFRQESISGLAPDAEPTPDRLATLRALVAREGVTTIFTEALISPQAAQTLADEAGVRTSTLDTLEGLTAEQVADGQDYDSIMRTNLDALRAARGCS